MKRFVIELCFLLTCCSFAGMASAQNVDATKPDEILNVAKGFGSAELDKDNTGDPKITGMISGVRYGIFFYGCSDGSRCKSLQFVSGWKTGKKIPLERINQWNKEKRYGKAYLDGDDDPGIDFAVEIEYGMSRRNLEECFRDWEMVLNEFKKDVIAP
jgi:hypothetical protein